MSKLTKEEKRRKKEEEELKRKEEEEGKAPTGEEPKEEPKEEEKESSLSVKDRLKALKEKAKKEREELEEKLKALKEEEKKERAKIKKEKEENKGVSCSRTSSFALALLSANDSLSESEISEKANSLYIEKRGESKDNLKESRYITNIGLSLLSSLNFLSTEEREKEGKKEKIYSLKSEIYPFLKEEPKEEKGEES